ncbi:MAG: TetR/AcrR family transcriptional regulator [Proteobacteria bacterium]|nr:TetR/AcrR family transcriptional regulator [Pseudomonadota bacterium]
MGVKERKEREKLQRSQDILEAARRVFESKGFLNTTLQDVAKEAEISVGLIYRYFQSKEDMFASLALKGAEQFDKNLESTLKKSGRKKSSAQTVLTDIAKAFFDFYSPYGEYFDMLLYSYKGLKQVQIQGSTLTRLMSVTLGSLDKLKTFIVESAEFRAKNEDEALQVVFLLWGILLGCHKIFDGSGRGHLFAFSREDFITQVVHQVMVGIAKNESTSQPKEDKRVFFDERPDL